MHTDPYSAVQSHFEAMSWPEVLDPAAVDGAIFMADCASTFRILKRHYRGAYFDGRCYWAAFNSEDAAECAATLLLNTLTDIHVWPAAKGWRVGGARPTTQATE